MTKTQEEPTELQAEARKAVLAIGGPGTKAVLESSLDAAEDKPIALRDLAVLGEAGREAGPAVERLLDSQEPEVRVAAARTLGFIGYGQSQLALQAALEDEDDWRLVYAAADALGRLRAAEARGAPQATATGALVPTRTTGCPNRAFRFGGEVPLRLFVRTPQLRVGLLLVRACGGKVFSLRRRSALPCPAAAFRLAPSDKPASLAERLAYDREIRSFGADGPRTTRRRTIPSVGLRVDGGWLVGANEGEWGGELVLKSDAGATAMVLQQNIASLHVLSDGRIVAVTGLAHLTIDEGSLYAISCTPATACTARWWKALPAAPRSSWLLETGELLINTNGGTLLVDLDGGLSLADCHAENSRR
jgi:hypothetical protein